MIIMSLQLSKTNNEKPMKNLTKPAKQNDSKRIKNVFKTIKPYKTKSVFLYVL